MSNSTGKTDIPSQNMKVDSKKKTVPLGTNRSTTLKILQWNAGGFSYAKMTAEADDYPDQYRHLDNQ
jgi:hypothetical protein